MTLSSVILKDLNNNTFLLPELLNKEDLNLLLFYNTNCLGCTGRALPLAHELNINHEKVNLIILHSNFKTTPISVEEIKSVFTNQAPPFKIYREDFHDLYDYFGCEGTPHWILMNGSGDVLKSFFGSQEGAQMKLSYAIQEFEDQFS
ncbi:hypothetical protein CW751_12275 [Brumimicrobium salinarum]|uniref:Alkyl hydroperoxide reductase subunit C/ Thiol specific antioxidant domain-containing protein n=1 Tax=Brumimicrobium salinarum TaxID=2058658 RepID=A0A2I0R092_9FLAO|nr:hypothetical protein [Brumimicrobium salinarum]PKR79993.1 hypothetical protein CW751_12275 [Brumimicrobium salinarum]